MAAKKNPLSEEAQELFMSGMRLVDIAAKLGVPSGTVRRWKNTYKWDGERSPLKPERSGRETKAQNRGLDDGLEQTLKNEALTPEEQVFCILYSRSFNATQSYLKSHRCNYNTANAEGYKLLVKPCVQKEIQRLKEIKCQQIVAGAEDIVEMQMRIAFADMGDYVSFGPEGIKLQCSDQTDTQLIREVKEGKNGITIKLADRQRAIDWLSKYFIMHPEDKYKAEYDRKKAGMDNSKAEQVIENMQTLIDILQFPAENRTIEDFEGEEEDEQTSTVQQTPI